MSKTDIRDMILPKLVHEIWCKYAEDHVNGRADISKCACNAKDNAERIIDLLTDDSGPGSIGLYFAEYQLDKTFRDIGVDPTPFLKLLDEKPSA